jgi:collagenase-like PrtC family protease
MDQVKLTLGPLLYNWSAERRRDFYFAIAEDSPYDVVHIGEVVCSKRQPFLEPYLTEILDRLGRSGKEIVLSSLMLVTSPQERESVLGLAQAAGDFLVEANDLSAAAALQGYPFMIGPMVNVYNEATLAHLAGMGAMRFCLPAELPAPAIAALAQADGIEIEIQAFGRLPLAISSRCYHARLHKLHKDGCRFVCGRDADGLTVRTLDETPFLAINGTQTVSHHYQRLLSEIPALAAAGVSHLRLWPQECDMIGVGQVYRDLLDGLTDATGAAARLAELAPGAQFANGFIHGRPGAELVEA